MFAAPLLLLFAAAALGDPRLLIRRTLRGDGRCGRELLRRLTPVIQARVRRALGWRADAARVEDLVQEVWSVLMQDSGRLLLAYDPGREASLEGYVGGIARRTASTLIRKDLAQKRGGQVVQVAIDERSCTPATTSTPQTKTERRELLDSLAAHLEQHLPERGQLVLRYCFVDGHRPAHVAQALGVKQQVVYNWQHRIRSLAREFVATQTA